MPLELKTHLSKKPKIFYGYWIVLVAFLCLFIMSGSGFYAFSFFVKPLQVDFGWSRSEIMQAFTVLFLTIGGIAPFIGRVVDRYGAKRIIVTGAIIVGLGFTFLTQTNHLWHFYLGYGIVGVGMSAMGQIPASTMVSNWFNKKRGFAIGLMATGVGGGGFILAPVVGVYLIPTYDWRITYLALAVLTWALIIPAALLIIKMKPADIGLYPDGLEAEEALDIAKASASSPSHKGLNLIMMLALPAFWLIAVSFFLNNFTHVGIVQSQVPYLQDIGFPITTAATALGGIGLASGVGKFFFGWLCDKIHPKYACAIGLGLQLTGILLLINVDKETSMAIIWLYAILLGLGIGSWLPTMSMLTSTTFGLASYGTIFGAVSLFQSTGTAVGPLMAGYMYDFMGTYHWAFVIFAALYAIAIPAVLLVRRPTPAVQNNT